MNLFPCLICIVYIHVIAVCSNLSNTLMKLAKGSRRRITSFGNTAHRQLQTSSLSSKLSVCDDIVSECLTICNQNFDRRVHFNVWLFLMKIGCFGIFMIKNMITRTLQTKRLNLMMCIMSVWRHVPISNSWSVIVFCMIGNAHCKWITRTNHWFYFN